MELQAPLDLRHERFVPVDLHRLLSSDTWAALPPSEAKALFALWLHSWHEVPAGSLPNDETRLCEIAACSADAWAQWKGLVLRHWFVGSDGRLYHPVIVTLAELVAEKRRHQGGISGGAEEQHQGRRQTDCDASSGEQHVKATRPGRSWNKKATALAALSELGDPQQ